MGINQWIYIIKSSENIWIEDTTNQSKKVHLVLTISSLLWDICPILACSSLVSSKKKKMEENKIPKSKDTAYLICKKYHGVLIYKRSLLGIKASVI